jgi:hypothetical protein
MRPFLVAGLILCAAVPATAQGPTLDPDRNRIRPYVGAAIGVTYRLNEPVASTGSTFAPSIDGGVILGRSFAVGAELFFGGTAEYVEPTLPSVYHPVYNEWTLSILARYIQSPGSRVRMEWVGGLGLLHRHWFQQTNADQIPIDETGLSAGLVFGADVGIRATKEVSVLPSIRCQLPQQTKLPCGRGCASSPRTRLLAGVDFRFVF